MVSKYWLVMKSEDGRLIRSDSWGIMTDSEQEFADIEAMECLGARLIDEARALRRLRGKKAA